MTMALVAGPAASTAVAAMHADGGAMPPGAVGPPQLKAVKDIEPSYLHARLDLKQRVRCVFLWSDKVDGDTAPVHAKDDDAERQRVDWAQLKPNLDEHLAELAVIASNFAFHLHMERERHWNEHERRRENQKYGALFLGIISAFDLLLYRV